MIRISNRGHLYREVNSFLIFTLQELTLWRQHCLSHIFTYNHNFYWKL